MYCGALESQVEEGPSLDTGRFPVPAGFRYLLDATKTKAEFFDLCWDANRVLYHHREELKEQWCSLLVQRGLNDKVLFEDVPGECAKNTLLRPDRVFFSTFHSAQSAPFILL